MLLLLLLVLVLNGIDADNRDLNYELVLFALFTYYLEVYSFVGVTFDVVVEVVLLVIRFEFN